MPEPAYGESGSVALSLVNTRVTGTAGVFDRLADEAALTSWGRARSLPVTTGQGTLSRFHALRADARVLLLELEPGTAPQREALDRVNRIAAEPVRPVLTADRRVILEPVTTGSAEAAVARDLIRLLGSPEAQRIRVCAAEDCDRLFIQDHRRRQWCAQACGNRMRARRYTARHRPRAHQGQGAPR